MMMHQWDGYEGGGHNELRAWWNGRRVFGGRASNAVVPSVPTQGGWGYGGGSPYGGAQYSVPVSVIPRPNGPVTIPVIGRRRTKQDVEKESATLKTYNGMIQEYMEKHDYATVLDLINGLYWYFFHQWDAYEPGQKMVERNGTKYPYSPGSFPDFSIDTGVRRMG